jgi:hypothetical protein
MAQYSPVLKSSLPRLRHGSHVVRGFKDLIVGFLPYYSSHIFNPL